MLSDGELLFMLNMALLMTVVFTEETSPPSNHSAENVPSVPYGGYHVVAMSTRISVDAEIVYDCYVQILLRLSPVRLRSQKNVHAQS